MKTIWFIIFCLGIFINGMAQDNPENWIDVVSLKDGSKLKGTILSYDYGSELKFRLATGAEVVIAHSQVKSITQEYIQGKARKIKPYQFSENGFYNETNLSILAIDSRTDDLPAFGLSTVFGKQFNRKIGAGIGVGLDHYAISSYELIYSIFGEARGYLNDQNVSPYYTLRFGYGIPGRREQLLSARGGIMVSPSIGYRLGASEHLNMTVSVGYNFQSASYTYQGNQWLRETIEEQIRYKRMFLRIGLLF